MARRTGLDKDGFQSLPLFRETLQVRDSMGRTQLSVDPKIEGAAPLNISATSYHDPSLATLRRGISHWSRFESVYRQVESLKRKWPQRTGPELLTNVMLHKRGVQFVEQVPIGGGKQTLGGKVADVFVPSQGLVINLDGHWWHSTRESELTGLFMVGQEANGIRIRRYQSVVDTDLYRYDDGLVLDWALVGIQL